MREIVWITGGGSGIGRAIAIELAKQGHAVAISGRRALKLEETAQFILEATGNTVFAIQCDVTSSSDVTKAHAAIVEHFGAPISTLISNAGISPYTNFDELPIEEFDEVIAINLKGSFLVTRTVLGAMYEAKRGTIVQMLSIASEKAFKGGVAYGASKFALRGFTDSLREEARKHNVRVIGVLPGAVETDCWDLEERVKYHDRMMQPEDIAKVVVDALAVSDRALVEEIRIRPIGGDL